MAGTESGSLGAAAEAEATWFADLGAADRSLAAAVERLLPGVRRRALARTLLALGREGLLPERPRAGNFQCVLAEGGCRLVCEGFSASPILLRADLRTLRAEWGDRDSDAGTDQSVGDAAAGVFAAEPIEAPARLLEIVAAHRNDDQAPWRRLAREISDSVLNEALALAAHHRTDARLPADVATGAARELVDALRALDRPSAGGLFLDQWAATGHPLHTVPKTRIDLPPSVALTICPEFHPVVPVRLAAVRRERVCAELPAGVGCVGDWFEATFPAWFGEWRAGLEDRGLDPAGYAPIPVHPWQAGQVLPRLLAGRRGADGGVVLEGPELPMLPCLSVRSMVPAAASGGPGFKLALGVRLTSGVRTITPRSCHMGPRVSRLLRGIFERDAGFGGRADLLDEPLGAHVRGGDDQHELEKHFSFLARDSVGVRLEEGQVAVPAAALGEPFPAAGAPLLQRLLSRAGGDAGGGLAVFEHYAERFLGVVLRSYLVYGIALEAHGQNVLACFDGRGRLVKFLLRDLAGIRIHEPTLLRHGLALDVHPDRRTVVQHFDDHGFWIRHRAFHAHLGHIAHGLALATGQPEAAYWRSAGDITAAHFDRLKAESDSALWARERDALLEAPWSGKASLSMRLSNQVRDLAFTAPNPFRLSLPS